MANQHYSQTCQKPPMPAVLTDRPPPSTCPAPGTNELEPPGSHFPLLSTFPARYFPDPMGVHRSRNAQPSSRLR